MKLKRILGIIFFTLITFSNAYADNSELQCPKPWQILVVSPTPIPNPESIFYWFAPLMPKSSEGGVGMGSMKKAPFEMAEETEVWGKDGWVCYYWSSEVTPLSELVKKKDQLPDKAKELLPYVKYPAAGVIVYVKK